jgi:hypothetical protein
MRSRTFGLILILMAAVAMKSTQSVSADGGCKTNIKYDFPPNWYTILASKTYPEKPVVKQQLEELAAHGDLSKPPSEYDARFTATVNLEPGIATWNHSYTTTEWEYDYFNCTWKGCPGEWVDVPHCDPKSEKVYRGIQTMKFFLIPDGDTQLWYKNWEQSPTMMLSYPDFWMQVAIGDGGGLSADYGGEIGGPHFLYSYPLRGEFYLPSKLPTRSPYFMLINGEDIKYLSHDMELVVPVCEYYESGVVQVDSMGIYYYGYQDTFGVTSDIDVDPYKCFPAGRTYTNNKLQTIELNVTDYDFDIPGIFYIGVVTQMIPAELNNSTDLTPNNQPRKEPEPKPHTFEPSNIDINQSYINTKFTVWMIVSTPCWSGDGGCNTEKNP